jgi:uracil-DNA glycosylase family 4
VLETGMNKSYKDALSQGSANNNGQLDYSSEIYSSPCWADSNPSKPPKKKIKNPEELSKSEVVGGFADYAHKALDESIDKKLSMSLGEVTSKKEEEKSHDLSLELSLEDIKEKAKELEGNTERFDQLRANEIQICFVVKSFVENPSSDLQFKGLHGCFEQSAANLFEKMIMAMNLAPNQVFITAIENQKGEDRLELCLQEIKSLKPGLIITLGAAASNALLHKKERLSKIHGQFFPIKINAKELHSFTVMPLFHPEYLLINPNMKKLAWEDMQKSMKLL